MPETHRFVTAEDKNGNRSKVPEHFLGHPVLGKFFKSTAKQAGRSTTPSDDWTVKELEDHAHAQGIDLAGATKKAEILAAIKKES